MRCKRVRLFKLHHCTDIWCGITLWETPAARTRALEMERKKKCVWRRGGVRRSWGRKTGRRKMRLRVDWATKEETGQKRCTWEEFDCGEREIAECHISKGRLVGVEEVTRTRPHKYDAQNKTYKEIMILRIVLHHFETDLNGLYSYFSVNWQYLWMRAC